MKRFLFMIGVGGLLLASCSPERNVTIENDYGTKVVYSQDNETAAMQADCRQRGGTFNECGKACPDDAEICAAVCAPVCRLQEKPGQEKPGSDDGSQNGGTDMTDLSLTVPDGFTVTELTDQVSGARVMVGPDQLGNYWLSRTGEGIVSNIQMADDGSIENISDIFTGLNRPHGLALDPQDGLMLYIAETDKVSRVRLYTEDSLEELAELPGGGRHYTRSLLFGPDDRLYVSIGSTCDVCPEEDERRATIYMMNKDGSDFEPFATGLRNAVFMTIDPVYGKLWATEMGRDGLGDELPPDEVNVVEEGQDYGWPYCYGARVRDTEFRASSDEDHCQNTVPAKVELAAHVAPLGLAFVPEEGWPEDMALDLIIASHGSWDRSEPIGYKLTRIKLDDARNVIGREDFITGWLTAEDEKLGRPVDVLVQPGGIMYVTDDKRGAIYRVTYDPNGETPDETNGGSMTGTPLKITGPPAG